MAVFTNKIEKNIFNGQKKKLKIKSSFSLLSIQCDEINANEYKNNILKYAQTYSESKNCFSVCLRCIILSMSFFNSETRNTDDVKATSIRRSVMSKSVEFYMNL